MKRIQIDAERCAGCRICEMVCSFHHEGRFNPILSRVTVIKEDKHGFDYPVICHQCDPCPPIAACPSCALTRKELDIIHVDLDACTGCEACKNACVFNAINLHNSKPIICDLCRGEPVCVDRCPTKALVFTESKEDFDHPDVVKEGLLKRWGINV